MSIIRKEEKKSNIAHTLWSTRTTIHCCLLQSGIHREVQTSIWTFMGVKDRDRGIKEGGYRE